MTENPETGDSVDNDTTPPTGAGSPDATQRSPAEAASRDLRGPTAWRGLSRTRQMSPHRRR